MNKSKLSYLPFNFFYCLTSLIFYGVMLEILLNDSKTAWMISAFYYIHIVFDRTDKDYLEARIKELENK